jgi:hypothetical protein
MTFVDWMSKYESIWLFLILFPEMLAGLYSAWILKREFDYDEQKDIEKKQKRTRTTKKTTSNPGGVVTTEETSEVISPIETDAKDESK